MTNLSKVMDIFSDILSKTTDAPDEDSYKKAKAKTNGHDKDSASRLYGDDPPIDRPRPVDAVYREPYQELHYNPSRDESLSPSDKARKAAWMRQRSKDWFKDKFSQNMQKSRFEQQPVKGNFIPRPDPKKNTTSENEDETAVILAKESPIQGPGIPPKHSQPSKEVVGKGKKASQEIISEAATPDKSTYVVGMEKADSAENVRRLKDEEQYGREYDAMYFDRTKSIKDLSLPPDDEVRDAGSDRHIYQSDKAMDRDPDITRHSSVLRRDKAKSTRAHHQGEMVHARMEGQSMNMEKMILKAFGVMKARSAANRQKALGERDERRADKQRRQEQGLHRRLANVGMPVSQTAAGATEIKDNPNLIPKEEAYKIGRESVEIARNREMRRKNSPSWPVPRQVEGGRILPATKKSGKEAVKRIKRQLVSRAEERKGGKES